MNDDGLRQRVLQERQARGYFSARAAATAANALGADVSNTTWSDWEKGRRGLGDKMRRAVMLLFDWPGNWPDEPPAVSRAATPLDPGEPSMTELKALIVGLTEQVERMGDVLEILATESLGTSTQAGRALPTLGQSPAKPNPTRR